MRLYCEHRIPASAEDFWAWIHAPEFEADVAKAIGLREYRELERREEGGEIYRRIRVASALPASMASLVSRIIRVDEAVVIEEQWRSREQRVVRWRMTPAVLSDRVSVSGELRVEPAGAGRCKRILDGAIEARIFAVGGLLERAAVREVSGAYDASARVAATFAKARAMSHAPGRDA
jgi:hypothetical protein